MHRPGIAVAAGAAGFEAVSAPESVREGQPRSGLAGVTPTVVPAARSAELPCTDDPELFFAESPQDVETAKAPVSGAPPGWRACPGPWSAVSPGASGAASCSCAARSCHASGRADGHGSTRWRPDPGVSPSESVSEDGWWSACTQPTIQQNGNEKCWRGPPDGSERPASGAGGAPGRPGRPGGAGRAHRAATARSAAGVLTISGGAERPVPAARASCFSGEPGRRGGRPGPGPGSGAVPSRLVPSRLVPSGWRRPGRCRPGRAVGPVPARLGRQAGAVEAGAVRLAPSGRCVRTGARLAVPSVA